MDIREFFDEKDCMTRVQFLLLINEDTKVRKKKEPWLRTLTPSGLCTWLIKNQVPPLRALQVERITEGILTKEMLRPDLYPTTRG